LARLALRDRRPPLLPPSRHQGAAAHGLGEDGVRRLGAFVGSAGRLLDQALAHARIPRAEAYVTNALKHFAFTRRGERRIHDRPSRHEIEACKPWLGAELDAEPPEIDVLLGATAA